MSCVSGHIHASFLYFGMMGVPVMTYDGGGAFWADCTLN
jgi:hypothetical protein